MSLITTPVRHYSFLIAFVIWVPQPEVESAKQTIKIRYLRHFKLMRHFIKTEVIPESFTADLVVGLKFGLLFFGFI